MFKKIGTWWTDRRQRKREKWADDHSWIGSAEMDKAQRNFARGRRRGGQTGRQRGSRY